MASISTTIRDHVEATWLVDTHEHLPDESTRLAFKPVRGERSREWADWDWIVRDRIDDWSFLFSHYVCDDLCSAGLQTSLAKRFSCENATPEAKFRWLEPHWKQVRHTGYGQAIRHTLRILYGEDDVTRESAPRIAEKYNDLRRVGLYDTVLRKVARIEHCHVNTFENSIFHATERPDLLRQDIDCTRLTDPADFTRLAWETGIEPSSLDAWLQQIDDIFRIHGPTASAVKLKTAYFRDLYITAGDRARAEYAFRSFKSNIVFSAEEKVDLHNFLIRYVISRATECKLPIQFHTGYYSGNGYMPLGRVRNNQGDLCRLYQDFPDSRFVIFHIGYPYHHEAVAAAKHYNNVYVDMCWAWILDPAASIQFLRSFLTAVPYNKLFAFGGDYFVAEPIAGHAHLARLGITRAIASLVEDGLIALEETADLVEALMRGNALATFVDAPHQ